MQETQVWSLGQEDSLEKEMGTHSSILAWEIPWTEEPGRLQSLGRRVGHDLVTKQELKPLWRTKASFIFVIIWNVCVCVEIDEWEKMTSTLTIWWGDQQKQAKPRVAPGGSWGWGRGSRLRDRPRWESYKLVVKKTAFFYWRYGRWTSWLCDP